MFRFDPNIDDDEELDRITHNCTVRNMIYAVLSILVVAWIIYMGIQTPWIVYVAVLIVFGFLGCVWKM